MLQPCVDRELPLQKGDIVYIYKQIDQNWYEGEHHGRVGIFPRTYIEVRLLPLFPQKSLSCPKHHSFTKNLCFIPSLPLVLFLLLCRFPFLSFFLLLRRLSPRSWPRCRFWNTEKLLLSSTLMVIHK